MLVALIPMKNPLRSKQRLAGLLDPEERRLLAMAMFTDVLLAAGRAGSIDRVIVMGEGEQVAEIARSCECDVLPDPEGKGETEAVAAATDRLSGRADGILLLPADVPLVLPEDLDVVVRASGDIPGVTLCPSRNRLGTNGVLRRPGNIMPLTFGSNSFYPHCDLAHRLNISCTIVELPRLGLDIDRPEDVSTYLMEAGRDGAERSHTYEYLVSIDALERTRQLDPLKDGYSRVQI
jgi:2-phospho-L-lactate/phosphoenolpyruvate guanylyltransferase